MPSTARLLWLGTPAQEFPAWAKKKTVERLKLWQLPGQIISGLWSNWQPYLEQTVAPPRDTWDGEISFIPRVNYSTFGHLEAVYTPIQTGCCGVAEDKSDLQPDVSIKPLKTPNLNLAIHTHTRTPSCCNKYGIQRHVWNNPPLFLTNALFFQHFPCCYSKHSRLGKKQWGNFKPWTVMLLKQSLGAFAEVKHCLLTTEEVMYHPACSNTFTILCTIRWAVLWCY